MAKSGTDSLRNRIVEMRMMKPGELADHPRNWRKHPARQARAVRGVLKEIGIADALLAWPSERNGGKLTTYDGHLRKKVAPDVEWPVLITNLTDAEADYMIATLDTLTAAAEIDPDTLKSILGDVKPEDADVAELLRLAAARAGFDNCGKEVKPRNADMQKLGSLREKWGVESGQIWKLGQHKLMCGDCKNTGDAKRLMNGERGAMAFTSPPYNMTNSARIRGKNGSGPSSLYATDADNKTHDEYLDLLSLSLNIALEHCAYAFYNVQMIAENKLPLILWLEQNKTRFCDVEIWKKVNAAPAMAERVMNSEFEFVFIFSSTNPSRAIGTRPFRGDVSNVINAPPRENNEFADVHKATMPIWLAEYHIKQFTNCNEIVFEQFCGTGTTILACEKTGRRCRAMEIAPEYVAVTLERWWLTTKKEPELAI